MKHPILSTMAWLFSISLFLVGCTQKPNSLNPERDTGHSLTPTQLALEYKRDAGRFADSGREALNTYTALRYDLNAQFDWSALKLNAKVDITFKLLDPNTTEISLDSQISQIHSVQLKNGAAVPYSVDTEQGLLKVDLSSLSKADRESELVLTIDYTADARNKPEVVGSGALAAVPSRIGDPVPSHVLYTSSEPQGASFWLPCHNDPRNRAQFSIEFLMPEQETLISNGTLILNELQSHNMRRMKYATQYKIPNYLMAFAVGEFNTATRYHGALPVSLWARKGLQVDWDGMLKQITRQIAHYEKLLILYPFEKYAVVLLPEFGGGMENASITFQEEEASTQGQNSNDLGLTAHELGHQWFGDYMTVKTWDDLWIKEGMATLLAEESSRPYADENHSGRLFGSDFGVRNGDAISDPKLPPERKYTSGPYGRSAWNLTQIRSIVGEKAFWETLQTILRTHAFGNISTAEFIEAFRPTLGNDLCDKFKQAVLAHKVPELSVATTGTGPKVLTVNLVDEENALLAPLEVRVYNSKGSYEAKTIAIGKNVVNIPAGSFLVIDAQDRHAFNSWSIDDASRKTLNAQVGVTDKDALTVLTSLSANVQTRALLQSNLEVGPQEFAQLYGHFASQSLRFQALQMACDLAKSQPSSNLDGWKAFILKAALSPGYLGVSTGGTALAHCNQILPSDLYLSRWSQLQADPVNAGFSETEVRYLSLFAAEPSVVFQTWSSVATQSTSLRSRVLALQRLSKHLPGSGDFPSPNAADTEMWKKLYRNILETTELSELLSYGFAEAGTMKDKEAYAPLAHLVNSHRKDSVRILAICSANVVSDGNAAEWAHFSTVLVDASKASPSVQKYLAHPEECKK